MSAAQEDPVEPDIPEQPARQEPTTDTADQARTAVLMDPIMGPEATAAPATDPATTVGITHTEIPLPAMGIPSPGIPRALTPDTWGAE